MKFWVDAQLPPQLAEWLSTQFHVEAFSLRSLGLRDAADMEIFQAARQDGLVIISKDSDFVELISRYGAASTAMGNLRQRHQPAVANRVQQNFYRIARTARGGASDG